MLFFGRRGYPFQDPSSPPFLIHLNTDKARNDSRGACHIFCMWVEKGRNSHPLLQIIP